MAAVIDLMDAMLSKAVLTQVCLPCLNWVVHAAYGWRRCSAGRAPAGQEGSGVRASGAAHLPPCTNLPAFPSLRPQLAMQGASAGGAGSPLRRTSSGGDSAASESSISLSPHSQDSGYCTASPLRASSRLSGGSSFEAAAAAEQARLKQNFVSVLEARGWGQ